MSILLSAVHRRDFDSARAQERMQAILEAIAPEPVRHAARCEVRRAGRHVQGTLNLPGHSPRRDLSLCQGKLYDSEDSWWRTGSGVPDGSFAIIRDGAEAFEAVTDPAGSRMLWTYKDDGLFVVSNSERAATMYAGRFELNRDVVPWMVSTGTRGLFASYNRHLRQLPPAAVARLDKRSWHLEVTAGEIRFAEAARSDAEHLAALDAALAATFASFHAQDARQAAISLSGGVDSRALAIYLIRDEAAGWRSFTTGSKAAFALADSDVAAARRIATALGLPNSKIVSEIVDGHLPDRLRSFVIASEGRHDHLSRLDGGAGLMAIYREGNLSIIRGDQSFGRKASAPQPLAVRASMEFLLCSEIANLKPHLAAFGLEGQTLPAELRQRPGETLETWRDRLHQSYRVPMVLAALTEHKAGYCDTLNPLLSRRALELSRSLPDRLRTGKALFRELVQSIGPDLGFVGRVGAPNRLDNLRHREIVRTMREALASETAAEVFGAPFARWMRTEIHPVRHFCTRVLQAIGKRRSRQYLHRRPATLTEVHLDPLRLAFRLYIAVTMIDQLKADAHLAPAVPLLHEAA